MFISYGIYYRLRAEGDPDRTSNQEHKFFMRAAERNAEEEAAADKQAVYVLRNLVAAFQDQIDGRVIFRSNRSHQQRFKINFCPDNLDRVIELAGLARGEIVV